MTDATMNGVELLGGVAIILGLTLLLIVAVAIPTWFIVSWLDNRRTR